jgi:hypothetical protein
VISRDTRLAACYGSRLPPTGRPRLGRDIPFRIDSRAYALEALDGPRLAPGELAFFFPILRIVTQLTV